MRHSPSLEHDQDDDSPLERLKSAASRLLERLSGDTPQQALPMSRYRGRAGPVVPYHERRRLLARRRRRQDSSYALVFLVVLLVLVVGIFYGLAWALGGFAAPRGPESAPATPPAPAIVTSPSPSPTLPAVTLPTPAPGGSPPSPSPLPSTPAPGTTPAPGPGTPDANAPRTYTIKPGDTPNSIARQFGITAEALMRANNITDPRTLRVGDTLTIPPPATPTR